MKIGAISIRLGVAIAALAVGLVGTLVGVVNGGRIPIGHGVPAGFSVAMGACLSVLILLAGSGYGGGGSFGGDGGGGCGGDGGGGGSC